MTTGPGDPAAHFDAPDIVRRNAATQDALALFLPDLVARLGLHTALDVGVGFGFFSGYAQQLGLRVKGIDVRPENVQEARRRYPGITFQVGDIEDPALAQLGSYDVIFCLGVMHHLENPLKALRNLAAVTAELLVVETMVTPFSHDVLTLYEEAEGQHQAVHYLGLIPSKSWLQKALVKAGFPFVFRPAAAPAHPHFRPSLLRHQKRMLIVASKSPVAHPHLAPLPDAGPVHQHLWLRRGLALLMDALVFARSRRGSSRGTI